MAAVDYLGIKKLVQDTEISHLHRFQTNDYYTVNLYNKSCHKSNTFSDDAPEMSFLTIQVLLSSVWNFQAFDVKVITLL